MRDWLILFSVKREFNKLFFVIRDLKVCVTREELELLTDISRDFTTLFGVILRCKCSGRLILRLNTSNVTSNRLCFN